MYCFIVITDYEHYIVYELDQESLIFGRSKVSVAEFLSRVSILLLTRDIDIAILSVRLSVTRWYCMKTA